MSVDEQKQHVLTLFSTTLRACDRRGDVSMQKLNMGLAQLLHHADLEEPVPLDPLMTFMLEAGLDERACKDVIVFFQNKTAGTGITFELPETLASLAEPVRAEIIDRMSRNSTDAVQAKIERPRTDTHQRPKKTKSFPEQKQSAKRGSGPSIGLLIAFALTLVAGGATYILVLKPQPGAALKIVLPPEQNFVGCEVIKTKGTAAVCVISPAEAEARDDAKFYKDAAATISVLEDRGFPESRVFAPDGRHLP